MPQYDSLRKLADLKEQGVLTDEEFQVQKQKIISKSAFRLWPNILLILLGALIGVGIFLGVAELTVSNEDVARRDAAKDRMLRNSMTPKNTETGFIAETTNFTAVGQCKHTSIASIGTRLENTPESGSSVKYKDGTYGVSYRLIDEINISKVGDNVDVCLINIPKNCPVGSDPNQGRVFAAINPDTGATWSLSNSEHECGGA